MKTTELRIGNYIFDRGLFGKSSVLSVVERIDKKEILTDYSCGNVEEHYKPVPLNEDYLLKLGFIKKDKTWNDKSISKGLMFKSNYFIEFSKEGVLFCKLHYSGEGQFLKSIKYVHQLQNLYFALTGEELIIK